MLRPCAREDRTSPTPRRRSKGPATAISAAERIAVVGAGSWGTALAIQFARAGRPAVLWGRETDRLRAMAAERRNRLYLPDAAFPDALRIETDLGAAIGDAHDVLIVVPSHALRATLEAITATGISLEGLAWATKGFERGTGLLPHQVVDDVVPYDLPTAVLSGPTFANEVAAGLPSALTIASTRQDYARHLAESITTETLRGYTSADIVGVEVGGATKNVFAIGAGICDGLGFGANTRIALLTRGLAEMTRLGIALGARKDTFMGLAGMGDLVLTCTDDQSRNRRFGLALASGAGPEQALADIGQVVEGYYAALAVRDVADRVGVDMPIVDQIYRVLYERASLADAIQALMKRPIMAEMP